MNRKIQPEIQTLKDFRILPPVRTDVENGIPLTVINAGEQDVVRMDILFGGGRWQQSQKLQAHCLLTGCCVKAQKKYTAADNCRKTGLLWFVARTLQFFGVCLHHCLFIE